ncbi:hypothetical protein KIPB_002047 [Kipferlia bialata]|uniref:Amino acid transporter transmembrane domain-containing protein n=1 Tax=Kipferlia bialata TaxID=797122 RepID=A0A9K3CPK7_9EUKA|nr:hypothetical protein KIPB_002047 [Kipferlia bialata]|eukprot:g2047.t1
MCGTAIFGDDTQDNVLLNFKDSSGLAIILKVMVTVMVTCAYPMVCHCARDATVSLAKVRASRVSLARTLVSLTAYTLALVIAIITPSMSVILVLLSGTVGTILFFLVPALVAVRFETPDTSMGDSAIDDMRRRGRERAGEIERQMAAIVDGEGMGELMLGMAQREAEAEAEAEGEGEGESVSTRASLSAAQRASISVCERELGSISQREREREGSILAATVAMVTGQRDYASVRTASTSIRHRMDSIATRGRGMSISVARSLSALNPRANQFTAAEQRERRAALERERELAREEAANGRLPSPRLRAMSASLVEVKTPKRKGEDGTPTEADINERDSDVVQTQIDKTERRHRLRPGVSTLSRARSNSVDVPSLKEKRWARILEMGNAVEVDAETEREAAKQRERERRQAEREEMEREWCEGEAPPPSPSALDLLDRQAVSSRPRGPSNPSRWGQGDSLEGHEGESSSDPEDMVGEDREARHLGTEGGSDPRVRWHLSWWGVGLALFGLLNSATSVYSLMSM